MNTASRVESFGAFQRKSYFGALDGLRAVSILLVILHHTLDLPRTNLLSTLQENGRYGVGFFFVISGFLICTLFLREEEKMGKIDFRKFYARRALRLLPLYYAVLLLQMVLVFVLHQYTPENQQLFRDKLPSYLFYFSNWLPTATQGPFFCAWSLAVEEQFYLAFGLLLFLFNRRIVIGVTLAALLIKFAAYQTFGALDANSTLWRIVFSYREPILFGVLTAFLLDRTHGYNRTVQLLGSAGVATILCVSTAAWLLLHQMQHESFWDSQLLYVLMTLTLASLVIRSRAPVLGNRFVAHVGKISYGIYLLHMFVISSVRKLPWGMNPWFCFVAGAVLSIAVAALVYHFFEKPIIDFYKRKLTPLNQPRPSPVPEPEIIGAPALAPLKITSD